MENVLNYKAVFDKSLNRIKAIRNPKAPLPEYEDLSWNVVLSQDIYDFGGIEFKKYSDIIENARNISISCLNEIIFHLQRVKHIFNSIDHRSLVENDNKIKFVLKDINTGEILIFKNIEDCSFWKMNGREPPYIEKFMQENHATSCKYVYLMFDYAYLQLIVHNEDETDPGRGYNLYSLKWFFETYYGLDEYTRFYKALGEYVDSVNEYLGYIVMRSLTPNAMLNFRKIFERKIIKFHYDSLLSTNAGKYYLSKDGFNSICKQYIQDKRYKVTLGNNDFSESFITAEWLYESMKKAKAIDLTVIALGYFKAVEQLLFNLICLHSDENRYIKKDYSFKDLPPTIEISKENIDSKFIDSSIGSMANFYKDNLDVFRDDLNFATKKYIREFIFRYKDLRNGYSHKDNIHDWTIIDNIREATYCICFLLLGAQKLSDDNLNELGLPYTEEYSDYEKLCEYVDFHAGNIFIFYLGDEAGDVVFGCSDKNSVIVNNSYIKYSGVYFKELGKGSYPKLYTEKELPKAIYLGKFSYSRTKAIDIKPVIVKKIYEDGKFIGPSIVEENYFDY